MGTSTLSTSSTLLATLTSPLRSLLRSVSLMVPLLSSTVSRVSVFRLRLCCVRLLVRGLGPC
uniref:Uncharacterized protein n=1 Tax=Brassica campestris TaxID=3711 RepID=A0A3P6C8S3_BRACM|nr:unnamed protein product [Brassica rapa]